MKLYHGTDTKTARLIVKTRTLKGDYPLFGVGVCTCPQRALNYAAIKVQKYLSRGREYARKNIAVIEFEADETILVHACNESSHNAYTLNHENGRSIKELNADFKILKKIS